MFPVVQCLLVSRVELAVLAAVTGCLELEFGTSLNPPFITVLETGTLIVCRVAKRGAEESCPTGRSVP